MPRLIETYRTVVEPSELDHLGHMNVQSYMTALSDAGFAIMSHLGLGPRAIREQRVGLAAVRMEIDFQRELMAGDLIYMQTTIEAVGTKSVTIRHYLRNAETDEVVMEAKAIGVYMSLESRQSAALPPEVRSRAEAIRDG